MIKRTILPQLIDHLQEKEITLLIGPRQAGKTTLMESMRDVVIANGSPSIFLNLDNESDRAYFESQQALVKYIFLQMGTQKGTIFIDEIQRKEDAGIFIKGLYDMKLPYKFVLSGSGSIELKERVHESLAGRKRLFEIDTISFEEFVNYKTDYKYGDNLLSFFEDDKQLPINLLDTYLQFGGYPKVVKSETLRDKIKNIEEIYSSYIEKDIKNLLNIQKSESFTNLLTIISSQVGQLVNYTELSATLGLDTQTIKNYLWYLRKTFILSKVTPFFNNIRKELTKTPIYYFNDLGMRNFALNRFSYINTLVDGGFLFQNFVFQLLKKYTPYVEPTINYWRTKNGAEVDFIMRSGVEITPVEVKYSKLKKVEISKSMHNFIKRYNPRKAYIVNLEYKQQVRVENTEVIFLPYYELLFYKNDDLSISSFPVSA